MNFTILKSVVSLLTFTLVFLPLQYSIAQDDLGEVVPFSNEVSLTGSTTEAISTTQISHETPISKLLEGKNAKEKANIKAEKLAKIKITEQFSSRDTEITIEVQEINKIEEGIEVYVRAWRNGKQLGFGPDGSVEIEKIKIINPPVLVREDGDIKEDLEKALKESILHTVEVIAKEGINIVKGKVGRTTTTVYTSAGTGAGGLFDGYVRRNYSLGGGQTFSTIRSESTGGLAGTTDATQAYHSLIADTTTNRWRVMQRGYFVFGTYDIPDTDSIYSATLSLYVNAKSDNLSATENEKTLHVVSSSPSYFNNLVTPDYSLVGDVDFGNVTYTSISTSSYTNIELNSSGISNISKTSKSKFATRSGADLEDDEPAWSSGNAFYIDGYFADQSGTTNDPKLIIEHGPELFTLKVYAETNDGYTTNSFCNEEGSWSSSRSYSGSFTFASCTTQDVIKIRSDAADGAYQMYRGSLVFDTSAVPDTATVTAATLNLYGSATGGENTTGIVLTSHTRASTTSLSSSDWHITDYGSTSFGSTTVPLATSSYNVISLNSIGISHISDTGLSVFGLLTTNDFINSDPGGTKEEVTFLSADVSGTSTDPYIEITFTN